MSGNQKKPNIYYQACQGEGCLVIMELPFEKYKNIKYCFDCREKLRLQEKREYMRQKRESGKYGDLIYTEDDVSWEING